MLERKVYVQGIRTNMTNSISDSVTKLNTQLNKSMVLMEDAVDIPSQNHKRKSITINTKTQPPSATNSPVKSRKSILKKSFGKDSTNNGLVEMNGNTEELNNVTSQRLSSVSILSRPRTVRQSLIIFLKNRHYIGIISFHYIFQLQEIAEKEMLEEENICCTFNLEDISDSEDIWIMDLPRSVSYSNKILYKYTIFLNEISKIQQLVFT